MHLTIQYFNNIFENDNRVYYKSMGLGFKILNIIQKACGNSKVIKLIKIV